MKGLCQATFNRLGHGPRLLTAVWTPKTFQTNSPSLTLLRPSKDAQSGKEFINIVINITNIVFCHNLLWSLIDGDYSCKVGKSKIIVKIIWWKGQIKILLGYLFVRNSKSHLVSEWLGYLETKWSQLKGNYCCVHFSFIHLNPVGIIQNTVQITFSFESKQFRKDFWSEFHYNLIPTRIGSNREKIIMWNIIHHLVLRSWTQFCTLLKYKGRRGGRGDIYSNSNNIVVTICSEIRRHRQLIRVVASGRVCFHNHLWAHAILEYSGWDYGKCHNSNVLWATWSVGLYHFHLR